jgi:CelD/BcsL family acetyltransferase involved in cellulose biosynthesis
VKLTAYNQMSAFAELQPEWNGLLGRSQVNHVFSTWEWQSTWWEAYQPGELWIIACRDEADKLIGIAPWFILPDTGEGRSVCSIGCVDVTDYLDIIVDKDFTEPVFRCLIAYLNEHRQKYDLIDLCNIPEASLTNSHFANLLEQCNFQVELSQQEVCPVIPLPDDWEAYLGQLDKKQRHELRRKIRRAESGEEKVNWYIVGSQHNLDAELEQFINLMAASQTEKARFLEDPRNAAFFRKMAVVTYEKGWLQLSFLTVNDVAAAAYLNFDYQGQILVYNSGLLPEAFGQLSPGIVLLCYNIQHAIETGHTVFDFLRGNETYKYRMGGQDTRVMRLLARKIS